MIPWPRKPFIHSLIHSLIHPQLLDSTFCLAPWILSRWGSWLRHTPLSSALGKAKAQDLGSVEPVVPLTVQASQMTSNPSVTQSSGLWLGSPGKEIETQGRRQVKLAHVPPSEESAFPGDPGVARLDTAWLCMPPL